MTSEVRKLAKVRRNSSGLMIVLVVVMVALYRVTPEMLAFFSGRPPEEISDIGIEALQKGFMAMFYLPWAALFATAMALVTQGQLREDAFGKFSRFAVLFCLYLLSFVAITT